MNKCVAYLYILIFTIVICVRCVDDIGNREINNKVDKLVPYSDSEDEDNFQVTEPTEDYQSTESTLTEQTNVYQPYVTESNVPIVNLIPDNPILAYQQPIYPQAYYHPIYQEQYYLGYQPITQQYEPIPIQQPELPIIQIPLAVPTPPIYQPIPIQPPQIPIPPVQPQYIQPQPYQGYQPVPPQPQQPQPFQQPIEPYGPQQPQYQPIPPQPIPVAIPVPQPIYPPPVPQPIIPAQQYPGPHVEPHQQIPIPRPPIQPYTPTQPIQQQYGTGYPIPQQLPPGPPRFRPPQQIRLTTYGPPRFRPRQPIRLTTYGPPRFRPRQQYQQYVRIPNHKYIRPTTQTTEPTELEPETIPVELGSDEEGGDEEDKEPSKDVKICKELKFFKMNEEGNLVEMVKKRDYKIGYYDENVVKYIFEKTANKVMCDGECVYEKLTDRPYCRSLIYNKLSENFIVRDDKHFILIKVVDKTWKIIMKRKYPKYIKFLSISDKDRLVQIAEEFYIVDVRSPGTFNYTFKNDVKCSKLLFKKKLVWEKTDVDYGYPTGFSVCERLKIILSFEGYFNIYERYNKKFRKTYSSRDGFY